MKSNPPWRGSGRLSRYTKKWTHIRVWNCRLPIRRRGRRLNSTDVLETLADLMILRGTRVFIRSDNGPESIPLALRQWIVGVGSQTGYIEPGGPPGRTATAKGSTASCAMRCSTAKSSSAWPRPRS
jgi:hypothetical protein